MSNFKSDFKEIISMKQKTWLLLPLVLAVSHAWADGETAEQEGALDPVVVTGAVQQKANTVRFNPKATIQPMPAGDGADLLQSVPNMSVIRKGGSSGDPLFRGLGGSRLSINADDQFIYGGCSNRMDPPTAYIFPNTYDEVIVTKGPQSVTQGAGLVAGAVQFVRKDPKFDEKPYQISASAMVGSNSRLDGSFEGQVGGRYGYFRTNISHNQADDYKDGSGNKVHSEFKRDNQMVQVGITPTEDTTVAATYERSRGKAAYADRMMDGSKFDRDAWNVRWTQKHLTPWFTELEMRYGKSKIDHVMDTYTLRTRRVMPGSMMWRMMMSAVNPERRTDTGNIKATFDWNNVNLQVGADYMRDRHRQRASMNMEPLGSYTAKPYMPQQNFTQWGVYAEAAWQRTANQKFVAGLRRDKVDAEYDFAAGSTYNGRLAITQANRQQNYRLNSGFLRWEQQAGATKYYAGFGLSERAPDYWERRTSTGLKREQNRQIDAGMIWKTEHLQGSLSVFAGDVRDFILLEKCPGMMCLNGRNINATRFGGEAEFKWQFAPHWEIGSSLAYTRGKNRTDGLPLAQTPPLEWRNTLAWDNGKFSAGALWRVAAAQKRYAAGQGNIVGQDLGAAGGFGTLSLNAGWRIAKYATLQGGVDNLFNKTYAEFVSKGGDPSAGTQTTRVNEPGRTAWVRLQMQF